MFQIDEHRILALLVLALLIGCQSPPPHPKPKPVEKVRKPRQKVVTTVARPRLGEVTLGPTEPDQPVVLQFDYEGPVANLKTEWTHSSWSAVESMAITESGRLEMEPPADGWPSGDYQVAVSLDGREAARLTFSIEVVESPKPVPDLVLTLPGPASASSSFPALAGLERQAQASGAATHWRLLADTAVKQEAYSLAARAYRQEAAIYRASGDVNAALVEEGKAARYATVTELYRLSQGASEGEGPLARLEPASGCYVGAFIDRDDNLKSHHFNGQTHGDIPQFNQLVGKEHATFFMYRSYGRRFPTGWVEFCKKNGAIPHIAWEPADLAKVQDDAYLQGWVEAAKKADWPIFLRFAGEMNGAWTAYSQDPEEYKRAFRLVYQAFREAPQVALIWCPNTVPASNIHDYYPGHEFTDWVGVNFYNVLYLDNDPQRPGEWIHPTDLLDAVYQRYSPHKPIAIGEYAATQESRLDAQPRPDFAVTKIGQLYSSLATRYPQVKMVNWYDCNNLRHARPGRQLNNYLVTSPPEVLSSYSSLVASGYFLGAGERRSSVEVSTLGQEVEVGDEIQAWVKTYVNRPKVYFKLDDRIVHASDLPGRWQISVDEPGEHHLKVFVFDRQDRFITSLERRFRAF